MDTPTAQPSVEIFSTPTCHFCQLSTEFFDAHNVQYTNHDVSTDLVQRQAMIEMTGQMGVPVIKIGNDIVIGFDKEKLGELLHISA